MTVRRKERRHSILCTISALTATLTTQGSLKLSQILYISKGWKSSTHGKITLLSRCLRDGLGMWTTTAVVMSMSVLMFVHVLQSVLMCNDHQVMLQHLCSFIVLNFLTLQCRS